MTGPAWLAGLVAAVMLLIAAGAAARLAMWQLRGRAAEPEADALHVLMGIAMAGMLEPGISPVPDAAWRVVFAVAGGWFAWRAIRARAPKQQAFGRRGEARSRLCAHPGPHCVESAAMVYMLLPAGAAGQGTAMAMSGMVGAAPAANPAVALVLALFMAGYVIWTADRMTGKSGARTGPAGLLASAGAGPDRGEPDGNQARVISRTAGAALAPRVTACSTIAMSLAMGYMLLTMM
jgi:Domain of unknown function (DUF5134)